MPSVYKDVGEHVRARRRQLGMTLESLSGASGVPAAYIGQIERNEKKTSLATLSRIADALDVHPSSLMTGKILNVVAARKNRLLAVLKGTSAAEEELILATVRHLSKALRKLR